jgi:GH15 family glucan-1,4-alpha-glucosidase
MTIFKPIHYNDGYLPLEDHGLLGDGNTAALVGRDGAITWMCVPRFDSPPLFCGLLDSTRGGAFIIAPDGSPEGATESRQFYESDSAVLVTEIRNHSGLIRLTDALTLRSGADLAEDAAAHRCELLRAVEVLEGEVRLCIQIEPRGGAQGEGRGGGLMLRCPARPELELRLDATLPLEGLQTKLSLKAGERCHLSLRWGGGLSRYRPYSLEQLLQSTLDAWRRWASRVHYDGPQTALVRRSAITLKLLDHFAGGAIVAAPTSSLPEAVGGERNWDYRYAWIRDTAFSVYALHRIGCSNEAAGFLSWALEAAERAGRPRVLYDLDGNPPPRERTDLELTGYRGSRPVRWGNAAADQIQHDVYGEILDCAYQWSMHHGRIDPALWAKLRSLIEAAGSEWREPDQGIWEVRTLGRPFTYSAALCQVALDRGARLAERFNLPGDTAGWSKAAAEIRRVIMEEAWEAEHHSLSEHIGGGGLDASLLTLPLRRVVSADHPRMIATTEAIRARLDAGDGLLYRYLVDESPDGLAGHEGAFLICSFWLVDNLAYQGRLDEALELYDSLCRRASPLGLLPEQIDPVSGAFLGNFPQAFSHVGLISSGVNLARLASSRAKM